MSRKSSKPGIMTVVVRPWLEQLKRRLVEDGVEIGPAGPVARVPLLLKSIPVPTRIGIDESDNFTPFVQYDLRTLYEWYYAYKQSRAYHEWIAYADIIPLRNGNDGFVAGQNVKEFRIIVKDGAYSIPQSLVQHKEHAVKLFKALKKIYWVKEKQEWENDQSIRIISWSNSSLRVEIQRAWYFDQVGTNLTLDWASGYVPKAMEPCEDATIRSCVESPVDGRLRPLQDSVLANTLGVAAFVLTNDQQLLIPIRGKDQAIFSEGVGKFHCSASGVCKWQEALGFGETTFDLFVEGMHAEIKRELNLPRETYDLIPLAFARELPRGGKPQLFFFAKCNLSLAEVQRYMDKAEEKWEFLNEESLPPDSPLNRWLQNRIGPTYTRETLENCFTCEGWMGLRLARAYLDGQSVF